MPELKILRSAMLQDENVRLPGDCRHDLAHRVGRRGLQVYEVTVQKLQKFASRGWVCPPSGGGLLHQDHTWAAMRQCRLHLVASAKISA
jgi:hypothetical protein